MKKRTPSVKRSPETTKKPREKWNKKTSQELSSTIKLWEWFRLSSELFNPQRIKEEIEALWKRKNFNEVLSKLKITAPQLTTQEIQDIANTYINEQIEDWTFFKSKLFQDINGTFMDLKEIQKSWKIKELLLTDDAIESTKNFIQSSILHIIQELIALQFENNLKNIKFTTKYSKKDMAKDLTEAISNPYFLRYLIEQSYDELIISNVDRTENTNTIKSIKRLFSDHFWSKKIFKTVIDTILKDWIISSEEWKSALSFILNQIRNHNTQEELKIAISKHLITCVYILFSRFIEEKQKKIKQLRDQNVEEIIEKINLKEAKRKSEIEKKNIENQAENNKKRAEKLKVKQEKEKRKILKKKHTDKRENTQEWLYDRLTISKINKRTTNEELIKEIDRLWDKLWSIYYKYSRLSEQYDISLFIKALLNHWKFKSFAEFKDFFKQKLVELNEMILQNPDFFPKLEDKKNNYWDLNFIKK